MKQKLGIWLLSLVVVIGATNFTQNTWGHQSTLAQSTPAESGLELMDVEKLDAILREQVNGDIRAQPGQWRFSINEISIIVLADPSANRMRIFSPVVRADELDPGQIERMMLANFHTALDARYAIANSGLVVSTFIHPLSSLQESDLLSALNQVSSLTQTFGSSYSSGEMLFIPGGGDRNSPPPAPGDSFSNDINTRKLVLNERSE
ncbi:MAG: hypothetical protein AAFQ80_12180 [Cyanobacteria bacterium J06621_8]